MKAKIVQYPTIYEHLILAAVGRIIQLLSTIKGCKNDIS